MWLTPSLHPTLHSCIVLNNVCDLIHLTSDDDEKKECYVLTVKTNCFDCDLAKRYDSRYKAISDFKRISKELEVIFNGECCCEDDPRFKRDRTQFVIDI